MPWWVWKALEAFILFWVGELLLVHLVLELRDTAVKLLVSTSDWWCSSSWEGPFGDRKENVTLVSCVSWGASFSLEEDTQCWANSALCASLSLSVLLTTGLEIRPTSSSWKSSALTHVGSAASLCANPILLSTFTVYSMPYASLSCPFALVTSLSSLGFDDLLPPTLLLNLGLFKSLTSNILL